MGFNKNLLSTLGLSDFRDEDTGEFVQLITPDAEDWLPEENIPTDLPILPIKNTVLFPGVVIPITVGRQKSIRLVKKAYRGKKVIGVVAQKNMKVEDPGENDIHKVGTLARILKLLILPDGNTTIIIQGKQRFEIEKIIQKEP